MWVESSLADVQGICLSYIWGKTCLHWEVSDRSSSKGFIQITTYGHNVSEHGNCLLISSMRLLRVPWLKLPIEISAMKKTDCLASWKLTEWYCWPHVIVTAHTLYMMIESEYSYLLGWSLVQCKDCLCIMIQMLISVPEEHSVLSALWYCCFYEALPVSVFCKHLLHNLLIGLIKSWMAYSRAGEERLGVNEK